MIHFAWACDASEEQEEGHPHQSHVSQMEATRKGIALWVRHSEIQIAINYVDAKCH